MYHFIVGRVVRWSFERMNAGDYEALLKGMGREFIHTFPGKYALGGTRHTVDGMRRWFKRLFLFFPDLHFEIKRILVKGWPWNTVAAVEWVDRARPQDGVPYSNEGVHILRMRWGRIVGIHAYLDTQKIEEVCRRLSQKGMKEAAAPPIEE